MLPDAGESHYICFVDAAPLFKEQFVIPAAPINNKPSSGPIVSPQTVAVNAAVYEAAIVELQQHHNQEQHASSFYCAPNSIVHHQAPNNQMIANQNPKCHSAHEQTKAASSVNAVVGGAAAVGPGPPQQHQQKHARLLPARSSFYCASMSAALAAVQNKKFVDPPSNYYSAHEQAKTLAQPHARQPPQPTKQQQQQPEDGVDSQQFEEDVKMIKAMKYTHVRFVHLGPFSRIHLVKDALGMEFIAKVESSDDIKKTLGLEARVYQDCGSITGIPTLFKCSEWNGNRAMVLQKLGTDLSRIRRALPGQNFSRTDALKICLKTFCRVWTLHNHGWLHRDIKPSNFVVGQAPEDAHQIYIVDFGLSRPICEHERQIGNCPIVGTSAYQPIAVHNRAEYRPKDDLESWFYMCCQLVTGSLPWLETPKEWMLDMKLFCKSSGRHFLLNQQTPAQFDTILDIIHGAPKDRVDYYRINALLKNALAQLGEAEMQKVFTWQSDPSVIQRALALQSEN